jgi:hypothetical protein
MPIKAINQTRAPQKMLWRRRKAVFYSVAANRRLEPHLGQKCYYALD